MCSLVLVIGSVNALSLAGRALRISRWRFLNFVCHFLPEFVCARARSSCGVHGRLSCALCLNQSSRTCSSGASIYLCCEDSCDFWPCQKAWILRSLKQCEMNQYERTNNDDLVLTPSCAASHKDVYFLEATCSIPWTRTSWPGLLERQSRCL